MTIAIRTWTIGLALLCCVLPWTSIATAQDATPCPKEVLVPAQCWLYHDAQGAYVVMAKPKTWNGVLVVHAHGGPRLPAPKPDNAKEDLDRFAVIVNAGYAWTNSTYRRGGYGVGMAVEDTESARRVFIEKIAQPQKVILHGQSWGGNVAAKLHETVIAATPAGTKPAYDAVLLTSGVLGGGTHGYDYRLDLRVLYQYFCHNHPLPTEPQYPLWMGLPADSKMTRKELEERVDACTGVKHYPESRTPAQQLNLKVLLAVSRIPERTLVAHMSWATFLFRDVVHERLGGKNPFTNVGVRYAGSNDDEALNREVPRYTADPAAVAQLAADSDLYGTLRLPTLTLHAIHDPTAFVEHESRYRDAVLAKGKGDLLVQTFIDAGDHSYAADPVYPALLQSLLTWAVEGRKPSPADVAAKCQEEQKRFPGDCKFVPDYRPQPYNTRVYPR